MEKSIRVARILVGIGSLLTTVPLGVIIVAFATTPKDLPVKALQWGWAMWVTFGLLPLGLGLLFVGLGYLTKLKRQQKILAESDED